MYKSDHTVFVYLCLISHIQPRSLSTLSHAVKRTNSTSVATTALTVTRQSQSLLFFFFLASPTVINSSGLTRTLLALSLHVPRPGSPLSPKQWGQLVDLVTPSQDLFLQRSSYLLHL